MDRSARSQADHTLLKRLLLRQFVVRSIVGLAITSLSVGLARVGGRVLVSLAISGIWMMVNCAAMGWVGHTILTHHIANPPRAVAGFLAIILGSLALGSWVIATSQPSLVGLAVGVVIPMGIFLYQLRQLNISVNAHAR